MFQLCFSKIAVIYARILKPLLQDFHPFQQIIKTQGLAMDELLLQLLIIQPP